jgi:pyrroline-5-carboxylate reductase
MMENIRICFIGCGNMGRSLIGGLISNGHPVDHLCGADIDSDQRQLTATQYEIEVHADNQAAIQGADVVVVAVKPQVVKQTVSSICEDLVQGQPLLISIAAGIRLLDLGQWVDADMAIVRVMPNIPVLVQTGASTLCANTNVNNEQHNTAEAIMRSVGLAVWLEDESLMDAVTALSGSGPAYYFLIMEAMQKAAIRLGLPEEQTRILTLQTAFGAAKMALESDHDPATLRQQVTSPGGTTEQALNVLLTGGIEELFCEALAAAHARSIELAEQFGKDTK